MAVLFGTSDNDTLIGGPGDDTFLSSAGNDLLNGNAGSDSVSYASTSKPVTVNLALGTATKPDGVDTLISIENVFGGSAADTLIGDTGNNILYGQDGNDSIDGGDGDDFIYGGLGNDVINGGAGQDTAFYSAATGPVTVNLALGTATGAEGNDTLIGIENVFGGSFADTLTGDNNNNHLMGSDGADTLIGGGGDDILDGGLGNDSIDGGSGVDTTHFLGNFAQYATSYDQRTGLFTIADLSLFRDGVKHVQNVEFFVFADGIKTATELSNGLAPDTVPPTLLSVTPANGATGVAPDTPVVAAFSESISRGTGSIKLLRDNATVVESYDVAGSSNISIDGNTFTLKPTLKLLPGTPYTVDVPAGALKDLAGNLIQANAVELAFTSRGTTQVGTEINDTLTGGSFEDDLDGGDGDDELDGGDGNDFLQGGKGTNILNGGPGIDTALYSSASGPVTVNLALGTGSGPGLTDTLTGIENVSGSPFADTITGDAADNELLGLLGDDALSGGKGKDSLDGGPGADHMEGGEDDDTYMVDDIGDQVIEIDDLLAATPPPGKGLDLGKIGDSVIASISYALPNFVENLTLAALAGKLDGAGNALDNVLVGNESDNSFNGGPGNDAIDGAGGIDMAQFSSLLTNYTMTRVETGWVAAGSDGTDTLTNIERLQFSGSKLALDLRPTEHGGQALEFIGLIAPSVISSPSIVGTILGVFDQGISLRDVCQLAIDVGLVNLAAGSDSNEALAAMAVRNVVGIEPSASVIDLLVSFMDGRAASASQAEFMAVIAGLEENNAHIGLVGLQQTGVEYV